MDHLSYITGSGLVTALGADAPSTRQALLDGQFITTHAPAKLTRVRAGQSRVAALATQAALEAVASAGWSRDELMADTTAIIFGTSKGDITDWFNTSSESHKTETAGWTDPSFGLARVCDDLCEQLGRPAGPRLTISAACASGLQALIRADLMLRSGGVDRALVVAAEASIHPLFLASFDRLGVLAVGDEPGRPFDHHRRGFRMSEAAAAVTLERSPCEKDRSNLAVTFTHMAGDATHLVAGDPAGRALRWVLDKAFRDRPIEVIHAHGTGTRLNDQIEADAITAASTQAGGDTPVIYSHKGALGHSLGASGLVSVVLADAMHRQRQWIPMATTTTPMSQHVVGNANHRLPFRGGASLILANGFGGPQTAIVLSK